MNLSNTLATESPTIILSDAKHIAALGGPRKSHLYDLVARGLFPQPAVRLGPRYTRWHTADVLGWMADPQGWIAAHAPADAVAA